MKISGLMKLTLLDYPGKVACTVFLAGCNFRCPFCHNGSLVRGGDLDISEDELFTFLARRKGVLDGVCLTGGEPTLYEEIFDLARKIKALGFSLKLDTNGSNPERLGRFIDEGLCDYAAMDVKSSPEGYAAACGTSVDMKKIKESIAILKTRGIPHEFRTTVVKGLHTKEDVVAAARLVGEGEPYFLQCYKESDDVLAPSGLSAFSTDELNDILAAARQFNSSTSLRGV